MESLAGILFLLSILACILFIISLFTAKTLFFVKNKTKKKAILTWLAIAVVLFAGAVGVGSQTEGAQQRMAERAEERAREAEARAREKEKAQQEAAQAAEREEAERPKPLAYTLIGQTNTSIAGRKRGEIVIALADPDAAFRPKDLAATCVAAAKYFAKEQGFKALSVLVADVPGVITQDATRLASCNYSPDGGGWSGSQGWTWGQVQAVDRNTTPQERQVSKLWWSMRDSYQTNGMTNEPRLKKAIAKKMGITPEEVDLVLLIAEPVPQGEVIKTKAQAPAQ